MREQLPKPTLVFPAFAGIADGFVKATYAGENGGQSPTVTPAFAGVQDLTNQWRSLCLEFLDSRLRGNDELDIFMVMTGEGTV